MRVADVLPFVSRTLALAVLLSCAIGCDAARRPAGPNVVVARDGGRGDTGAADMGGALDAEPSGDDGGAGLDARTTGFDASVGDTSDGGGAVFDAQPPPDAQVFVDAQVFADAQVFLDAQPLPDAQPPPDAQAPDAQAPGPDGGQIQDAGTPACTSDAQCASGRCHPLYGQCVPVGQRLLCEPCATDAECGLPTDHCLTVSAGGTTLERICAQACRAAADCPRGYDCTLSGHCYPVAGSIRLHTCASLRDMYAREGCNSLSGPDTCGVAGYDDGTCVPTLGCSIGCDVETDCPPASTCTNYIVANYCVAQ